MKTFLHLACVLALVACSNPGPTLNYLDRPTKQHLRGAAGKGDLIAFSGTHGTVVVSKDGGESWEGIKVPGADSIDFRDIELRENGSFFILSAGNPALIFESSDCGKSWEPRFNLKNKNIFMDGMAFSPSGEGMAFGDPYEGNLACLVSEDGEKWSFYRSKVLVPRDEEAGFAASGSGIQWLGDGFGFVTGGESGARFIRPYQGFEVELPLAKGPGAGAFSLATHDNHLVVVGGSYLDSLNRDGNAAYSEDGGLTWKTPKTPPFGYRSVVVHIQSNQYLAAGRTGVDLSNDGGKTWKMISSDGFFTATKLSNHTIALGGRNGKLALVKF